MTSMSTELDARWEAVTARDKSAEGRFVYAVVTTGIYCRPTCPSRRPLPENVRFFASKEEAERAGFRPCKRCKPDGASIEEKLTGAVAKASALIEAADGTPDFNAIAEAAGLSRHHLHRAFKRIAGITPGAYFKSLRERRAIAGLRKGAAVTEAIYDAGYGSSSRFYETLAPKLGLKPGAYTKGGTGEVIRFAAGKCSLGSILVAATEKGVCAIELGDTPEDLIEAFQRRFPDAELVGGDPAFEQIVAQAVSLAEQPERGLGLPLHVRGTAFQLKVWEILRGIRAGETMTYQEIAAKAGAPGAVRAAANACAANKIAIAIPCHRAVRTGGALSGYRWGARRKAALLERERKE
ncbi:MAG: bifunctional DNA-binding transcriptional regulator/O6-methylguanine-DNA methyltransferase Ada [Rhodomicrobium sp.]|nr:bifunctional DNA-binding transcriptional regulator/O6-methylguanine-DNA methyltransferase Ada [Rhodomicrobium sp.]